MIDSELPVSFYGELLTPPPRKLIIRATFAVYLAFGVLMLLFGLFLASVMVRSVISDDLLKKRGIDMMAKVADLETRSGKGGPHHFARYRYVYQEQDFEGFGLISDEEYGSLSRGSEIAILVDPLKPTRSAINLGQSPRRLGEMTTIDYLLVFSPLVAAGMGGFLAFAFATTYRQESRALRFGDISHATILTKEEVVIRGSKTLKITYNFSTPSGEMLSGERDGLSLETPEIFLEEPIVFYVPRSPRINAFYPMKTVRLPRI